jgi:hypothetical protein
MSENSELLAQRMRDEAAEYNAAAEKKLAEATYKLGQAEHARRTAEDNLRAAAECKRWLEQHDETKVRAIVADANKKLAEAKALMADYNSAKHGAAKALVEINAREKAEAAA